MKILFLISFLLAKIFYIHKGKVLEVKIDEGIWYFSTFQTNAKKIDQVKLSLEEGNIYIKESFK
ncbi:hypothetical protein CN984_20415 [Bacillus cereus]|uniref:Uncharacterized protein n=1 Tax=Bacillus cereus TaxID=1396 RepID=A0A2B3U9V4_BACCE|nr:hypothetical protein COJ07_29930 [Bacillus cereus]PFU44413.1 hypothetical protein COK86_08590 [Bacillus cereus]PGO24348.1 hypothetical protein CN984_20415 [Bacillus cereus]